MTGMIARSSWLALFWMGHISFAWAGAFERDFVVVYVDTKTEARFGAIPLNRGVLAQGVDAIADAGARGLVLKFFLDQPKLADDDERLARALSRLPTVLQARMDDAESKPNPLPQQFTLQGEFNAAVVGQSGWLPLPVFMQRAKDIGFVDFNSSSVPMIEQYQSRAVKSLMLCAMELAAGTKATISPGRQIEIGQQVIALNPQNLATVNLIAPPVQHSVSFSALLDGSARAALKGKVVILAYDGPHIEQFDTSLGAMGAHRYFVNILRSLYGR
ncbi:CHASE2 domain-containing protein [Duganella sp. sic0402]|uniref:CHASE2 domain-containing protein n=1 Tax=Duganella sp. sic0402 TaxID=2854786 RepID=UPI001C46469D|nr:CHASE2 domain-containing protein [Duganella sp. sic0402]MBV7537165.1 CHASE2 domain-containing protein [Duganella sp. sic0402]